MKNYTSIICRNGLYLTWAGIFLVVLSRLIFPFDLGNYESTIWISAEYAIRGENPYAFLLKEPFIASPYGYLYYLLVGSGLKLFGLQFWFGRLLGAAAAAGCGWTLNRFLKTMEISKMPRAAAGLVFFSSTVVQLWIGYQRVDFIALFLGTAALLLIRQRILEGRGETSGSPRWSEAGAVLLLVAAVFCKHTFILPVIIGFLLYLAAGYTKPAFRLAFLVGTLFGGAALILNYTSGGAYYLQHFYFTRFIPGNLERGLALLQTLVVSPFGLVLYGLLPGLTGWLVFSHLRTLQKNREQAPETGAGEGGEFPELPVFWDGSRLLPVLGLYFIFSLAVSVLTSSREGASLNYYAEFIWVTAILAGCCFEVLGDRRRRLLLILILLAGSLINLVRVGRGEYFRWQALPYYQEIMGELGGAGINDSDVCFGNYSEYAAYSGCRYYFNDWMQYTDGRSAEMKSLFEEKYRAGTYRALLLHDNRGENLPAGCRLVETKNQPPDKAGRIFLYLCAAGKGN